jgi:hypothetical protein
MPALLGRGPDGKKGVRTTLGRHERFSATGRARGIFERADGVALMRRPLWRAARAGHRLVRALAEQVRGQPVQDVRELVPLLVAGEAGCQAFATELDEAVDQLVAGGCRIEPAVSAGDQAAALEFGG